LVGVPKQILRETLCLQRSVGPGEGRRQGGQRPGGPSKKGGSLGWGEKKKTLREEERREFGGGHIENVSIKGGV